MGEKTALVSGSSTGIGLATVKALAGRGYETVLTSLKEGQGRKVADALGEQYPTIHFHVLDITEEGSISAIRKYVAEKWGRLDVLVNNAGILEDTGRNGLEIDPALVRKTLEVNTLGHLRMSQAFIPLMQKHNYGRIVNISSGMGQLNDMGGGYPAYRLSKTALNAVTRILSSEVQGSNILVNSICPGWVKTAMGGPGAERSPEKAAEGIVWAATLPDNGPSGGFFRDGKRIGW